MVVSDAALSVGLNLAADDTPRNRHTFPRGRGSVAPLQGRNRCLLSDVSTVTISTSYARCAAGDSRQTFINYSSSDVHGRAGVIWMEQKKKAGEPLKEGWCFHFAIATPCAY